MIVLEYILLVGVIVCAIAAPLCKRLLASVIVYMALSLMMAVLWSLLQSPDLAITEAAVGATSTRCDQHPLFPDAEEDPRAEGDTG